MARNKPDHEGRIKDLEDWREVVEKLLPSIKHIRKIGWGILGTLIIKVILDYIIPWLQNF
jgi:hypothetical protein